MPGQRRVRDERDNVYTLADKVAEGGQGAVFKTTTPGLVVKVRNASTPDEVERIRRRLDLVRRLGLGDLDVIVPARRLVDPDVGYVMELMTEMVKLDQLRKAPPRVDLKKWYCEATGGLRRRLVVLAALARTLAALHGRGLVYGDVSPSNLWISADPREHAVRLIDLDNVAFFGTDERTFTPHYGAPELEHGDAFASSLSDAYAFAVLAFEVLAAVHPLYGDLVTDGDPELEVEARRGLLPWIDDAGDERNRSSEGFPREVVLSNGLRRLARATFGAGRGKDLAHRLARPGLAEWADELEMAADRTLVCPACHGSYFFFLADCPFCDDEPRPASVMVDIILVQPDTEALSDEVGVATAPQPVARMVIGMGETRALLERHVLGRGRQPVVEIAVDVGGVRVRRVGDSAVDVLDWGGRKLSAGRVVTTLGPKGQPIGFAALPDYALGFGPQDGLRRVACLSHVPRRTA